MWSNGNSFDASPASGLGESTGNTISAGPGRWTVPAWKFGLRLINDRRDM